MGWAAVALRDGDTIFSRDSHEMLNENSLLKLEEEAINEEVESEKISPIRISHLENIIASSELSKRFINAGLNLVSCILIKSF